MSRQQRSHRKARAYAAPTVAEAAQAEAVNAARNAARVSLFRAYRADRAMSEGKALEKRVAVATSPQERSEAARLLLSSRRGRQSLAPTASIFGLPYEALPEGACDLPKGYKDGAEAQAERERSEKSARMRGTNAHDLSRCADREFRYVIYRVKGDAYCPLADTDNPAWNHLAEAVAEFPVRDYGNTARATAWEAYKAMVAARYAVAIIRLHDIETSDVITQGAARLAMARWQRVSPQAARKVAEAYIASIGTMPTDTASDYSYLVPDAPQLETGYVDAEYRIIG